VAGHDRLEYLGGKVLYQTSGWISHARISPGGDRVAFIDHQVLAGDGGAIVLVDSGGKTRMLSRSYNSAHGLAWSPSGEIWFTAADGGTSRALRAVTLAGRERVVSRMLGGLILQDISRTARVLLVQEQTSTEMYALLPGETRERDLSWLDYSFHPVLSPDGKMIAFQEQGNGGRSAAYLRKTDGSDATRLGDGSPFTFSADGKWLTMVSFTPTPEAVLLPTGTGEPRIIPREGLTFIHFPAFLHHSNSLVFLGIESGSARRLYVQEWNGNRRAITPDLGRSGSTLAVSGDDQYVAIRGVDGQPIVVPIAGGDIHPIPGTSPDDWPIEWATDNRSVYFNHSQAPPVDVFKIDWKTGHRQLWRTFTPTDPAGVYNLYPSSINPDGNSYAYSVTRRLSELYLVDGLR
jgi:hypothetical protein